MKNTQRGDYNLSLSCSMSDNDQNVKFMLSKTQIVNNFDNGEHVYPLLCIENANLILDTNINVIYNAGSS